MYLEYIQMKGIGGLKRYYKDAENYWDTAGLILMLVMAVIRFVQI